MTFLSAGEQWVILEAAEICENGGTGLAVCNITLEPAN